MKNEQCDRVDVKNSIGKDMVTHDPLHPLEPDIINIYKEKSCKKDYKTAVQLKTRLKDFDKGSASRYENPHNIRNQHFISHFGGNSMERAV